MSSVDATAPLDSGRVQGIRILIVEDEALFAKSVRKRLQREDYDCDVAPTLADARSMLKASHPDLILLDMRLPDGSGLVFLEELRATDARDIPVVVLTAHGELEDAVAAMKLKAFDYLKKPIDLEELVLTLQKSLGTAALARSLDLSREREKRAVDSVELLGESEPLRSARAQMERIASLTHRSAEPPPTVLLLGETGSGKDVSARCLHQLSARASSPFVNVDCAALPKDLMEAELFGHEKGAYTSAHVKRTGLIEAAEGGTVFLDEIAELPLDLQPKLLAVLERRTIRRIGSSDERPVAAWFIAATNRNMEQMVADGAFRSDLYFRLKVLTLSIAPLRERGEDVLLLARHFIARVARRYGLPEPELDLQAVDALGAYDWPGNVRELAHLIERAVLLSDGKNLSLSGLLPGGSAASQVENDGADFGNMTLDAMEQEMISQALQRCNGNVSEAARQLGITRMAMRYRMEKYDIGVHG